MGARAPLRRPALAAVVAALVLASLPCRAGEVETMRQELPSRDEIEQLPPDGGEQFNRLIFETSPYLLQHARNPVDWWPWSDEAFERARELDRPVFLSVGYSTCHWCHVMERESFENKRIAELLNERFVPIKVDREERPDVDEIYMAATQLMVGRGGWPNSVWLTPDARPWYAGTYFPPEGAPGVPGFRELLGKLADTWDEQRDDVEAQAAQLQEAVRGSVAPRELAPMPLSDELLGGAVEALSDQFDERYGGFGGAPKFPPHSALRLLLFVGQAFQPVNGGPRAGDRPESLSYETLDAMARGGIHDHVGGGFHRYSTDAYWLVPHFEKMLYDNAQLAAVYALAHQATGSQDYEVAARGICDWALREMADEAGGFYSALDADSEGVEGKFYLWTRDEVTEVLGGERAALACELLNIRADGNFVDEVSGHRSNANIPHISLAGLADDALRPFLRQAEEQLRERRSSRVRPHRDEKVLASWNGLMISGLATAGRVFGEQRYIDAAVRAADFILREMRVDGQRANALMRVWRDGAVKQPGYLDDYAFLAVGLLDLHVATGDERWLTDARWLADETLRLFEDRAQGGFFLTAHDSEELLARVKRPFDQAIPSGNAMAALALVRLADLTGEERYSEAAGRTLRAFSAAMRNAPTSTGMMLLATAHYLNLAGDAAEVAPVAVEAEPDARTQRGPVTVAAWASRRTAEPGGEVAVALRITIADGWHINAHKPLQDYLVATEIELEEGAPYALMEATWPDAIAVEPAFSDEPLAVYEGEAWVLARVKVLPGAATGEAPAGNAPLRLTLVAQPCDDSTCARPERYALELPMRIMRDAPDEQRNEAVFERFAN